MSKVHILLQHMGRRGQLDKIGSGKTGSGKTGNGQGPRWKLAPRERDVI